MQGNTNTNLLQAANAWFATLAAPEPAGGGERSIGLVRPQPQLAVKDSNMANFGTKLEYDIKHAAATTEKAWTGVGKGAGLWAWRINKFKLEAVPSPGAFFAGDSYVVLFTRVSGALGSGCVGSYSLRGCCRRSSRTA